MNVHSFASNAVAGFILAILTSTAYHSLSILVPSLIALQLAISLATFFYVVYLALAADIKAGKVTLPLFTAGLLAAGYVMDISLAAHIALHIFAIWLIRSIYLHRPLTACIDFVGSAISIVLATWAALQTDSLFISTWTFYLTQAVMLSFLLFPNRDFPRQKRHQPEDKFALALRSAESAFKQLNNI